MKMKLLFVVVLGLTLGCGPLDSEDVGVARQAVGQSCLNGYNPFQQGWPVHGFCNWMPGLNGTASLGCNGQLLAGEANVYSAPSGTQSCAKFSAQTSVEWPSVAYDGWNAVKIFDTKSAPVLIRSVRLGALTKFEASQGPNHDAPVLTLSNATTNLVTIDLPRGYQVASWYNGTL